MGNDVTVADSTVKQALTAWQDDLSYFIPDPGRLRGFLKSAALCIFENPDLKAALTTDQGKASMIRALERAAASGLSLNPQEGKSALVVKKGKVVWWPMKNGLAELALESGQVDSIEASTIFANDKFVIKKTARGDEYELSPALKDRGEAVAYFAAIVLKSGRVIVGYMTKEQVEKHRDKYGQGLDNQAMPWRSNFNAMAEKTVLKATLADVHLGKPLADAIEADARAERDVTPPTPEKGISSERLVQEMTGANESEPARERTEGELDIF